MSRSVLRFGSFVSALCLASVVMAEVTQPDGVVMPLTPNNGEIPLQALFDFREGAGTIDAVTDAATEPATFRPLCDFAAQFLLAETGSRGNSVGWYNSPATDTPPTLICNDATDMDSNGAACDGDEVYIIVPGLQEEDDPRFSLQGGDPLNNPGQPFTGGDIVNHPHYAGGDIGFVLMGGQPHYSELRLNPVCVPNGDSCTAGEHWIPAIMYRSQVEPNAFYMGVEDQVVGPAMWGNNDGDFNDFVIYFTGLVCTGAGEPCETGELGVCGRGVTGCSTSVGGGSCEPLFSPEDETCNGLDDDCDGDADEGDDLCGASEVCFRGACVPSCGSGEFPCSANLVCHESGVCVEQACLDVECEPGEVCQGGECQGPCRGVVCPGEQFCSGGRCIDPCEGVECPSEQVCKLGICIPDCQCTGCPGGEACSEQTRLCGDPECATVTCDAGMRCVAGGCVDDCEGVVCPGGAACTAGLCGEPAAGSGGSGAGGDGAGGTFTGAGGSGASSASAGGNSTSDGGGTGRDESSASCACRAAGSTRAQPWAAACVLLLVGLLGARRRARHHAVG